MTTEQTESISFKKFSNSVLPWIVLGGALLLYLLTLNHFVSLSTISVVAKVAGWDWQPPIGAPLYYLTTLPVKWLPAAWQPMALNVFSAVCASFTLALLARSVALLPHDRTKDQRAREHDEFSLLSIRWAWIPPVVAVLLCGFQLTFWENATVASGEMLDLLVFAYVIRCLLEFRLTERESWLWKFAVVYGLGMANNWAMVGYFPLFLLAVVWIRGFSFFNVRFILRLLAFGCVGLLLYLLLPLVATIVHAEKSFWETLKLYLAHQKNFTINNPFIGGLKFDFLTMALTSLLPMLVVGTRWTSDYADVSPMGTTLTNLMFRVLHLALLVFCVWVFFDYKFSPRVLGRGFIQFTTFYYLSALSVGYLCGYVLLVFGRSPERAWGKSRSPLQKFAKTIAFVVAVAAIGIPAWLFYRNLPAIRQANGATVKSFAQRMANNLPKDAVILADEQTRLYLMQALDAVDGAASSYVPVNTALLANPKYHQFLRGRYPGLKDAFIETKDEKVAINAAGLIRVVESLHKARPVYYLHPSFGYFFERFYPRQHGLAFELKKYQPGELQRPKLMDADIDANEKFWSDIPADSFKALAKMADRNPDAAVLCTLYSAALNTWGVELQRNHVLKPAEEKFYLAWKLEPNNVIAQINGRYNGSLQKGDTQPLQADQTVIKELNYNRGIVGAISYFGPVDEPGACLVLGQVFRNGMNWLQAAQQFMRVVELLPDDIGARLALAQVLADLHQPDLALKHIAELRKLGALEKQPESALELLDVESKALLAKNQFEAAENLLMEALEQNLADQNRQKLVVQFYVAAANAIKAQDPAQAEKRFQKAIGMIDQIYATSPDIDVLLNKVAILLQMGKNDRAIQVLDGILANDPTNGTALINRAILQLQAGRIDAAKSDYEAAEKTGSTDIRYRSFYGLAEICERTKDTAGAIKNYKAYLEIAPANTLEYQRVVERLKDLQAGKKT